LLHGLQTPTSGTLHWGSQNTPPRCAQAYVPTSAVPFRRSVLANILLALHLKGLYGRRAERIAHDALDICQLTPLIHQPARNLSSGETQKLFLARAWALGATTLLLDEPTGNLDPTSSASIEALINDLHQNGVQIVLVTHNIAQARRLADEVVFLDQGCWCEQANAQTFFAQPKTRPARAYLAGQLY
ncbi:MAG: ATP-binding cassette domain-containing protein, partial [Alphaproteobacteria bacterium]|nr:ATP-binding cassette domain-containing protein [Alphaproteobacteria bacterium]